MYRCTAERQREYFCFVTDTGQEKLSESILPQSLRNHRMLEVRIPQFSAAAFFLQALETTRPHKLHKPCPCAFVEPRVCRGSSQQKDVVQVLLCLSLTFVSLFMELRQPCEFLH